MQIVQEPNYYGDLAQNLANSLSNMLGFGPMQKWQGLLQSLGQSGMIPQYQPSQQVTTPLSPDINPQTGEPYPLAEGAGIEYPGEPSRTTTMPAQGINLQALGKISPQFYPLALQLLGQQAMSPEEQAKTGLYKAETAKARAETRMLGQPDISKMQATATGLRKEFDALSAPYRTIRDSYSRMMAASEDPSAAGDIAILYNYMKILDPGSVVRESEYATAENAAGVPDRIRNLWNKALSGEKITYNRQDFLNTAERLYQAQEKTHNTLITRYSALSKRWNVSPEDVITKPSNLSQNQIRQITNPTSVVEFENNIREIRQSQGDEAARRYYEVWKGDFR